MLNVSLLLLMHMKRHEEKEKFAFLQYMEGSLPHNILENVLARICLPWSTEEDIDFTFEGRCFGFGESSLSEG